MRLPIRDVQDKSWTPYQLKILLLSKSNCIIISIKYKKKFEKKIFSVSTTNARQRIKKKLAQAIMVLFVVLHWLYSAFKTTKLME